MLPIVLLVAALAVLVLYKRVKTVEGSLAYIARKPFSFFCACLLAVFLVSGIAIVALSLRMLPFRGDVTSPESAVMQTGKWFVESGHLYPALETSPYTPAPYGPFFYAGVNLGTRLAGGDDHRARMILRGVVLFCYLAIPMGVYFLLRKLGLERWSAALGASAAIATPIFLSWNVSVRPDLPALFFSLLAVIMVGKSDEATPSDYFVAALACTIAVFLKQSCLEAPLAIVVFTLAERRWRQFLVFSLTCSILGVVVLAAFWMHGDHVLREMLLINASPLHLPSALLLLSLSLSSGLGVLIIPAGFVGFVFAIRSARPGVRFLSLMYLFAAVSSLITVLQVGADRNYFFSLWIMSSIMAASALPEFEKLWDVSSAQSRLALGIAVLLLAMQQGDIVRRNGSELVQYHVDRLKGLHILSTQSYLGTQGKDPELLDSYLSAILEEKHRWSPAGILQEIDQQKFDVVFVAEEGGHVADYRHQKRLSQSLVAGLTGSYQPLCRTAKLAVLIPKGRKVSIEAEGASEVLQTSCEPSATPLNY